MVSTAAFHARVRGSVPGLGGLKETKMFLPHPRVKVSIVGSLRDREVACSASDRQGSNFENLSLFGKYTKIKLTTIRKIVQNSSRFIYFRYCFSHSPRPYTHVGHFILNIFFNPFINTGA